MVGKDIQISLGVDVDAVAGLWAEDGDAAP